MAADTLFGRWRRQLGTVQNAQQFTSQLHQQGAAVQTQTSIWCSGKSNHWMRSVSAEANVTQAKAQFWQAQVNLECARIASPVDGLLAQLGDFVTKEQNS
jgi:multidrug resistance efflux pump